MVLPMLPNCYSNFPVYSVYIVNFEQINAGWVVGTTHFLKQEIAEAYVGLCQVSMRSILGGRRKGAVGSAWRPVRGRGRSGVLSDITHCALGFFFFWLVPTPPPPTSGDNAVSTFYVARLKLYGYRLTPSIMLVKMLMVTKIPSNSVRSVVFNSIQQVPQMNSMIPIQHVERVCG